MKIHNLFSTLVGGLKKLIRQVTADPKGIFQGALVIVGIGCLVWVGNAYLDALMFQMKGNQVLQQEVARRRGIARSLSSVTPGPERGDSVAPSIPAPPSEGSVLGRLEVPRLGISVIVAEGTTADVLSKAVGHIPGTGPLCGSGNTALAGHRDTFFRDLKDIRPGDLIKVTSPLATKKYRVDWTDVVKPTAVDVLAKTPRNALTLMTCYPFHFIGAAPERFIVRASEIESRRSS